MNSKNVLFKVTSELEQEILSTSHVIVSGNKRYIIPVSFFRFEEDEQRTYRLDVDLMPLTILNFFDWKYKDSNNRYQFPVYEKGNYFLMITTYGTFKNFEFILIDPSKCDRIPNPEHFRIVIKHPTVSQFLNFQNLLDFEDSTF